MPAIPVGFGQHRMGADELRNHTATVDVAHQHHRHISRLGKAHIGDVAAAQVDFRWRASTLDQDQIGAGGEAAKALQYRAHQVGFGLGVVACLQGRVALALNDHLRAKVGFRL